MIYDHISKIDSYQGLDPRVMRGLELLRTVDFTDLPCGRYEVEGDALFYMVQEYDSLTQGARAEAHRKYVDIQYMLCGADRMGVALLTDDAVETEARPQGDIWFYDLPVDFVTLSAGMFVVLYPHDAHMPAVAVDQAAPCRKIVVKVKMSD